MGFVGKQSSAKKISNRCYLFFGILLLLSLFSSQAFAAGPVLSNSELLDSTQAKAAKYFYEQSISNGFVKDTSVKSFSSIAGTGFGLAAFTVMAQRYGTTAEWSYTPAQLRTRTNLILDNIIAIQNGQASDPSSYGTHGLLFHFVNADNNPASGSEVSTVDNAILFAGVITAGEYFGSEVKEKANTILGNTDWNYFLKSPSNNFTTNNGINYQFTHGWYPSTGRIAQTWDRPTDEVILISVIALATEPDNNYFKKSLFSWPRVTRSYAGYSVVNSYFGSLFSYEFAHLFIDFEGIGADNPTGIMTGVSAVDWWQNSINAAKANRQFVINNSVTYSSYGADSWGLSAVEMPNTTYFGENGALPNDNNYANHNGTIAPYSSISTMPFFKSEDGTLLMNNLGFKVLRNLYDTRYSGLWGTYGPYDSFNSQNQYSTHYSGIDEGPIVLSIENYRTGGVMEQFMKNDSVKAALKGTFTCPNGVCDTSIICSLNTQCNDNNSLTTDECINPGTTSSYCNYTPTINCSSNNECNDYNFQTDDSCVNPGTTSSYCSFVPNGEICVDPLGGMQITTSINFCPGAHAANDINIAADNIVLDCRGASISVGSGTIFIIQGRNNVTIKNCRIQGGNYNIKIEKSNYITLIDNNSLGSWDTGLLVSDSNRLSIKNNKIKENQYRNGISFYNVNDSNVENNDLSYNGTASSPWYYAGGINMSYSNRNRVINNNMSNGYHGIYLSYSNYNYYSGNKMCSNKQDNSCGAGAGNTATGNTLPDGEAVSCSWLETNALACDQNCTDTDGGFNLYTKGTLTYWDGFNITTLTDTCTDANHVTENYCNGALPPYTTTYSCSNGCLDGACLNITCSTDGECNDYNSLTVDACVNSGTYSSACTHTQIACATNANCNDYNSSTTDTCVNPGTTSSYCNYALIACSTNAQCGTNEWVGTNFCNLNDVWNLFRTYTCNNPGTVSSACVSSDLNQLRTSCSSGQICSGGACVGVTCSRDSDCGTDGYINESFCQGNDVAQTYREWTCNSPGTVQANCSSSDSTEVKIVCSAGETCSNGACVSSYTYSWKTGSWSACSVSCGAGSQTRDVYCQRNDETKVEDSYCSGTKPGTSQACDAGGCSLGKVCTNGQCIVKYLSYAKNEVMNLNGVYYHVNYALSTTNVPLWCNGSYMTSSEGALDCGSAYGYTCYKASDNLIGCVKPCQSKTCDCASAAGINLASILQFTDSSVYNCGVGSEKRYVGSYISSPECGFFYYWKEIEDCASSGKKCLNGNCV